MRLFSSVMVLCLLASPPSHARDRLQGTRRSDSAWRHTSNSPPSDAAAKEMLGWRMAADADQGYQLSPGDKIIAIGDLHFESDEGYRYAVAYAPFRATLLIASLFRPAARSRYNCDR